MTRRSMYQADDEDDPFGGDEHYEECEVCHQEFDGVCPIQSADCPYADIAAEDDDIPDFEDVDNLDRLIADDEEFEKLEEEEGEIPPEDLIDEDHVAESGLEEDDEPVAPPPLEPAKLPSSNPMQAKVAKTAGKPTKQAKPARKSPAKKAAPKKSPAKKSKK